MNRKDLHRRSFLRGLGGVAVGLPFLEAFAPRTAFAAAPKRMAIFFQCNGVNMERFWPKQYGPLDAAALQGSALAPLAGHASKLLIPRGIHMAPRGYSADKVPGCDHQKGMGCKLTCAPLPAASTYPSSPSIDQVVAKRINPGGKLPLNLAVGPAGRGVLSSAFYTDSGQPAPMVRDPWNAFKDWAGSGTKGGAMAVDLAAQRRKSVLDIVRDDLKGLQASPLLSSRDKQKLDLHFTGLRNLETSMTGSAVNGCDLPEMRRSEIQALTGPAATSEANFPKVAAAMMEIMALAMACDQNRVVTVQVGNGAGGPIYRWCGDSLNQQYNHHKLSHGATTDAGNGNLPEAEWKTSLFNIDTWHMQMFKILLDRLASYSEPGGSVLDNSAVLYMNELSNGQAHAYNDLPIVIAGGAGGALKQGQYIKMTTGPTTSTNECPTNVLFTTVANAVGYRNADGSPMTNFGTAVTQRTGEYTNLKV